MSLSYSLKQTYKASFFEKLFLEVIKQGPIPKHCAIIMDGNRRFAKRFLSGNLLVGYKTGHTVLLRAVHMFLDCGIEEMTVYAFSQDNFKRQKSDVESILCVMLKAFRGLEEDIDYMNELGICFEAIGEWENIPDTEITKTIARLMLKTKGNNKLKINMALGYSGRQEIVACADTIVRGLEDGLILPDDLSEELVQNILTLGGTKPVDLLIRTSGETRVSDFLLWNTNDNTWLEFVDVSWPEFKLGHFLKIICAYQKQRLSSESKSENVANSLINGEVSDFVEKFKAKKWEDIEALCKQQK